MKRNISYILIIILIIACSRKKKELLDTNYKFDSGITMLIDSIMIPLDDMSLPIYDSPAFYIYSENAEWLYAYNKRTHSIDMFDIKNKNTIKHITLERMGPNGILDVHNMHVLSADSIALFDVHQVSIIDSLGKIVHKIPLKYQTEKGATNFHMWSTCKMMYKNNITCGILGMRDDRGINYDSIVSCYNANTNKWTSLPIKAPDYYAAHKNKFGINNRLSINFYDDRICYNVSCDPNINIYNIKDNRTISSGGCSKILKNLGVFIEDNKPQEEKWKHFAESPQFYPIIYDKYKNKYYRIQAGGTKQYEERTTFDKEYAIAIFDEELNMIYETKLPVNTFWNTDYYATPNGLLFAGNVPNAPNTDYEVLKYYIIKFDGLK